MPATQLTMRQSWQHGLVHSNCYMYICNKKLFKFKHEAQTYANTVRIPFYVYYYDDIYSKIDWTIEPPESLEYYYREQAQRIRDEYDYVILAYSGGYDSTNILEIFHRNNIKLDKIISVGAFSKDSSAGSDENHNGEIYANAYPTIKKLGLESVYETIDYTKYFDTDEAFTKLSISNYENEWALNASVWFSPHNWFWKDIDKFVIPEHIKGKRVALIFGKDKAYLYREGREFGFRFNDKAIQSYYQQTPSETIDKLAFYWNPSYPNILLKQLHELYKRKEHIIDKMYSLSTPLVYKSPKSRGGVLSLRDQYLFKYDKHNPTYKLYIAGLNRANIPVVERESVSKYIPLTLSRFYKVADC